MVTRRKFLAAALALPAVPVLAKLPALPKSEAFIRHEWIVEAMERIINPPFVVGLDAAMEGAERSMLLYGTGAYSLAPEGGRILASCVDIRLLKDIKP